MTRRELSRCMVAVSPHLDDAVLSLAATLAAAARTGADVRVLTVFAGDPDSEVPARGWDTRGGYATEGQAAAGRRVEDRAACAILGVEPVWLQFSDGSYAPAREPAAVYTAVAEAVSGVEAVLVPGFPLTNPDHAWLAALLLTRPLPCARIALYAEQPYRYTVRHQRRRLEVPTHLCDGLSGNVAWRRRAPRPSDLRLKRRAIAAYRSQLPLLGLTANRGRKLRRMLLHEALHGGEAIAWIPR
jgi:LmbE family N-acetylglucosaminyl deacetylase